jgi:hypothetical protein
MGDAMKERAGPQSCRVSSGANTTGETVGARAWRDEEFMGVPLAISLSECALLHKEWWNPGILAAVDASAGKTLKQSRVQGALDPFSASPVAAEGMIYVASESGKIAVIKPGADWEVITVNDLKEDTFATPALSKGQIFLRTTNRFTAWG